MSDERRSLRPWYRARNIVLAVVVGIGALAGWSIFKAVTAVPGPTIDYAEQLRALSVARQPAEGADGYPVFMGVLAIVKNAEARVRAEAGEAPADHTTLGGNWPVDYSMITSPSVHPLVYQGSLAAMDYAEREGLYRELDRLVESPRVLWPKHKSPLIETLLPHLGESRNIARMGAARMDLAAARGDWDEFARAFEHTLAVSRVCDTEAFLISHLVSIAIDQTAIDRARRVVAAGDVSEAALVRMLAAMDRQRRSTIGDAFESERIGMLDTIQNMFTDDGSGDGMLVFTKFRTMTGESTSGPAGWKIANLAGLVLPGKKATIAKIDEMYTGLKGYAAASPAARRALAFQPDRWVDQLPAKYAPLKILAPSLSRPCASQDQHESMWNGARVMLAIEIYKRRNGAFPPSLDALVPELLKEIPRDPFAPTGFRYAVLQPGEDPGGLGYTLYSLGADGKDDAGAPGNAQNSAYNSTGPSGDYQFNSPQ